MSIYQLNPRKRNIHAGSIEKRDLNKYTHFFTSHGLIAPKLILQLVSWKNILVLKVIEMHYAHLSIEALSVTVCKFMHGRLHADATACRCMHRLSKNKIMQV